jgi:hypothetical protein
MLSEAPIKPKLTFEEAEAAWITEIYQQSKVILEYGSGGSTLLAGEQIGATVFAVESDRAWAANLEAWFEANPPLANVQIHAVNIGKTREWGYPIDSSAWRRFSHYPVSVWDREDFLHPDVVLIDGRFRPACFFTTMLRATKPVTVLFDDYKLRKRYHVVERYFPRAETRGNMVRFNLEPRAFPQEDMALMFDLFSRPQ